MCYVSDEIKRIFFTSFLKKGKQFLVNSFLFLLMLKKYFLKITMDDIIKKEVAKYCKISKGN